MINNILANPNITGVYNAQDYRTNAPENPFFDDIWLATQNFRVAFDID